MINFIITFLLLLLFIHFNAAATNEKDVGQEIGTASDGSNRVNYNFRIATLNCWALPWITEDKEIRIENLIKTLAYSDEIFDVITLQELWLKSDFDKIISHDQIKKRYPYAHYFKRKNKRSKLFGSGIAVFSAHPIVATNQHIFSVNGYPLDILKGDWYTEKSVILAEIAFHQHFSVAIFSTHTLADYSDNGRDKIKSVDTYFNHRLKQCKEIGEFVQKMHGIKKGYDFIFFTGDINSTPNSEPYNLIKSTANLEDPLENVPADLQTYGCDGNKYSCNYTAKRIDHIFYRDGKRVKNITAVTTLKTCFETFVNAKNGKILNYSDHFGLCSTFLLEDVEKK